PQQKKSPRLSTRASPCSRRGWSAATTRLQFLAAEEPVPVLVHPRETRGQAGHLLVDLDAAELAVAVEIGCGETLVETLAHLGFALRTLALVPVAEFGTVDVAVAIAVDRIEMLDQTVAAATPAATGCHFLATQAAVAIAVQPLRPGSASVATIAAPVPAMRAATRTFIGIEPAVAIAVELVETRGQTRDFRRFGAIDHAITIAVDVHACRAFRLRLCALLRERGG